MAETIWNTVVMVFHFIMKNIVIINILLSLIIVFFERRSPQAVWTWLLLLYFIPIVGFILFCLLYTPCIAAIASIRRELGQKWAIGVVILQCAIAWVCAFAMYHLLMLL